MAQYLILLYEDENGYQQGGQAAADRAMQEHTAFGEKHGGAIKGGNALQPVATATTIKKDAAGVPAITDGPFAETKEALGGYYLIEAADLDEAIAIAGDCPALFGGVELRPIMVFG
jgi:hypothetical protein